VKVVKFFNFAIEDRDEMFEKWGKYLEKAAKTPEKYPKYIYGPGGLTKFDESFHGVSIMEIDNAEQLSNYMLELSPPLNAKFEILFDANVYAQAYMERKK